MIREWHAALAKAPSSLRSRSSTKRQNLREIDLGDPNSVRQRRASANRIFGVLKAALNLAFREEHVVSDEAWRRVKPFREAGAPKIRYLCHAEAQRLAQKVVKGKSFDMADLKSQLEQLQKMGGVGALLDKLPGAAKKGALSGDQGDRELRRQIAIINSMTPRERRHPAIIDGSRRRRIAGGSGVQVQDVNRLLKQFQEMQRVMKSMKGGRLRQLMGAMKGGLPPGFPGR